MAAKDIVPALWADIEAAFQARTAEDERIRHFLDKVEAGTARSIEVSDYSMMLGDIASDVLLEQLAPSNLPGGRLYYNIADRTVRPLLQEVHELVTAAAVTVSEAEDAKLGIHFTPAPPAFPEERVEGLINKLMEYADREAEDGST